MRRKYDKRKKARAGQVRAIRTGEEHAYGGELSGIRANITKSYKLKT